MSRSRPKRDPGPCDREVMLQCFKLVREHLPAVDAADHDHPLVREQLDAHAELSALRDQLAVQRKPWPAILDRLRAASAERKRRAPAV